MLGCVKISVMCGCVDVCHVWMCVMCGCVGNMVGPGWEVEWGRAVMRGCGEWLIGWLNPWRITDRLAVVFLAFCEADWRMAVV